MYCWGKNDVGQVGCGDTYGDWRKQKAKEAAEKQMKEDEETRQTEAKKASENAVL